MKSTLRSDALVPNTRLDEVVKERAREFAQKSDRPSGAKGIAMTPLKRKRSADGVEYSAVSVEFSRAGRLATITLRGPDGPPPKSADEMTAQGAEFCTRQRVDRGNAAFGAGHMQPTMGKVNLLPPQGA